MLERQMEEAVSNCPDLFIEPGLTLVRRQVVMNGRRPDVLFTDGLSRHLLVEIQCGRLDENHLQRHCYYFYDYRQKYPSTHPRLMFIANRMNPQHKDFLADHGYEFKEIPEQEFARKVDQCPGVPSGLEESIQLVPSPGVLAPATYELIYDIERHRMTMSYKMLLLIFMTEMADREGRVPLLQLASRFQEFFVRRATQGKLEENPKRVRPCALAGKSLSSWERTIRDMPVRYLTEAFMVDEGSSIRWSPRVWSNWSPELKREILSAATNRLIWYFNQNAGGY
jgi:hypothetical protein